MNEYDLDILRLAGEGYCCSQIVMKMALEMQGVENPGLVRAIGGLCHGFPMLYGACGTVTGAACMLAYYSAKGRRDDEEDERLPLMLTELSDWFRDYCATRFTGIRCADIVPDGQPDTVVCGGLVSECYGRALAILVENGFDPGESND